MFLLFALPIVGTLLLVEVLTQDGGSDGLGLVSKAILSCIGLAIVASPFVLVAFIIAVFCK